MRLGHLIGRKIAPLASLSAQQRFILHATTDEYYLPEELLEDAAEAVRLGESAPGLTAAARERLAGLGRLLRESAPNLTLSDFITADSAWCSLRTAAQQSLTALGFDLVSWEAEETSPGSSKS